MKISICSNPPWFSRLVLPAVAGLVLIFIFLVSPARSAEPADDVPVHVTSDKMVAQKDNLMVEFIGNVKAIRQEAVLLADSIKIFFRDEGEKTETTAQSKIKKIVSTGHVRYTEKDRTATADQAVYTTEDDVLILTGKSPKLLTGASFVTGKKISLFRKQDRVLVESDGNRRVEALFNPQDNFSDKAE